MVHAFLSVLNILVYIVFFVQKKINRTIMGDEKNTFRVNDANRK